MLIHVDNFQKSHLCLKYHHVYPIQSILHIHIYLFNFLLADKLISQLQDFDQINILYRNCSKWQHLERNW